MWSWFVTWINLPLPVNLVFASALRKRGSLKLERSDACARTSSVKEKTEGGKKGECIIALAESSVPEVLTQSLRGTQSRSDRTETSLRCDGAIFVVVLFSFFLESYNTFGGLQKNQSKGASLRLPPAVETLQR